MNWPRVGNPTRDAGIYPTLEIIIKCIYPLSARTLLAPILYYVLPNNEGWHTIAINPHDMLSFNFGDTDLRWYSYWRRSAFNIHRCKKGVWGRCLNAPVCHTLGARGIARDLFSRQLRSLALASTYMDVYHAREPRVNARD